MSEVDIPLGGDVFHLRFLSNTRVVRQLHVYPHPEPPHIEA